MSEVKNNIEKESEEELNKINFYKDQYLIDFENNNNLSKRKNIIYLVITIIIYFIFSFYLTYLIDNNIIFSLYTVNCDFSTFKEMGFVQTLNIDYIKNEALKLILLSFLFTSMLLALNLKNVMLSGITNPKNVKTAIQYGIRKNHIKSPLFINSAALTLIQVILSIAISGFITSAYVGSKGCILYQSKYYNNYLNNSLKDQLNIINESKKINSNSETILEEILKNRLNNKIIESADNNNNNNSKIKNIETIKEITEENNLEVIKEKTEEKEKEKDINNVKAAKLTTLINLEIQQEIENNDHNSTTVYLQLFILILLLFPTPSSVLYTVKLAYQSISKGILEGLKATIDKSVNNQTNNNNNEK